MTRLTLLLGFSHCLGVAKLHTFVDCHQGAVVTFDSVTFWLNRLKRLNGTTLALLLAVRDNLDVQAALAEVEGNLLARLLVSHLTSAALQAIALFGR